MYRQESTWPNTKWISTSYSRYVKIKISLYFRYVYFDFFNEKKGSIYWRNFPESQTIKINDSITLKCEGESSEPLQYQWWEQMFRQQIIYEVLILGWKIMFLYQTRSPRKIVYVHLVMVFLILIKSNHLIMDHMCA